MAAIAREPASRVMVRAAASCTALLLAAAVLLPASPPRAMAQDAATGDAPPDSEGEVRELSISAARTDAHPTVQVTVDVPSLGGEVDIGADAFTVTENGETRETQVERLAIEDLEVMLVIDTSGSMAGAPISAAQTAATEFAAQMPPAVQLGVLRFSTEVELLSDFTTNRQATLTALEGLPADGWTSMYDAVHATLDVFDEREATRQAIVLLSDGEDTRSVTTLEETIERLTGRDEALTIVELITVGQPEAGEPAEGDDADAVDSDIAALNALADAAGQGSVVSPDDLDALTGVYRDIAASLLNQYELTFTSQATDAAELAVRFEHAGIVAEGARTLELPAAAQEPEEPEEDAPPEEPRQEDVHVDDAEGAVAPQDPLPTGWWTEPWAMNATLAIFIVGLISSLLYFHGWRLRDRFDRGY